MTTIVHINCPSHYRHRVDTSRAREVALATLKEHSPTPDYEMTIAFVGNRKMKSLNRDFLERDQTTDVLAFPAMETNPNTGEIYLGDIVISVPQANLQAKEHQVALGNEISVLIVHGALHLLGYDHTTPEGKSKMWAAQNALFITLNLSFNFTEQG